MASLGYEPRQITVGQRRKRLWRAVEQHATLVMKLSVVVLIFLLASVVITSCVTDARMDRRQEIRDYGSKQ